MSGGYACHCDESTRAPKYRRWFVYKRQYNTSAFNGYHYTPSDYSSVSCRQCRAVWRTKAAYVDVLPDGEFD